MRKHTKSRMGCKQCKQRKIKCDESRPRCVKCRIAEKDCSYSELLSHLPPTTSASSSLLSAASSPRAGLSADSDTPLHPPSPSDNATSSPIRPPPTPIPPIPQSAPIFNDNYSLFHIDLFIHFRGPLTDAISAINPDLKRIMQVSSKEALKAPYLMDELLAFAAAHKSTLAADAESKVVYQTESTRLQSRAIGQLGIAHEDVTESNFLALFIFSVILGQHTLFDTFSTTPSLHEVLDRFVRCMGLHHGIRSITGESAGRFNYLIQELSTADPIHWRPDVSDLSTGPECDELLRRLQNGDASDESKTIYTKAVQILQYLFDDCRRSRERRCVAVQEWPVRVSQGYISLLEQRRPEALIVMGHYAVLLHYARDYWAVGASGRFLIQAISNHLGPYWSDWLAWPNKELSLES